MISIDESKEQPYVSKMNSINLSADILIISHLWVIETRQNFISKGKFAIVCV
jgi:hypothetical protein